ncbi:MAG: DegT/DnrJ/EryC1/StrS family aminotransferase [Sulfuricurvum sp.]|nr:DegT/DnrJ/EryC1/StrS family aminotransferase [Sulfuricurvum sp.]
MINVTKPYLPNREKYKSYIDSIYQANWLTNNGPLVQELEKRLEDYLGVKNILLVSNGTLALQIAYKLLDLKGEVITTPFSFVATTSSLMWENLVPVFVDIDPDTFNLDPSQIEEYITRETSAILPVHVFGNSCEVEKIASIASRNGLKVIYDAAHAFGVKYKDKSVLDYGDISTVSFHATKLFHTIEGGALIIKDDALFAKAKRLINFGYEKGEIVELGINSKMNEFSAAMGLAVLDDMEEILRKRKEIWEKYHEALEGKVGFQKMNGNSTNNYHYFPIVLKDESEVLRLQQALNKQQIYPRRYFHPSLDTLEYLQPQAPMDISRDLSERILCLPIYPDLGINEVEMIISVVQAIQVEGH